MTKYLCVGDIHLSDRPPSSCTDTYLDDLFVILEHTIRLESELGVAGVIWSGDVFHHKQPSRTSHRTVQRAIDLVQAYKKLWIVPGNHDMLNDRYESLMETQPLGVLFQAGAELLNGWEASGQHPIYGVPWKQRFDQETLEEAFADWNNVPEKCFTVNGGWAQDGTKPRSDNPTLVVAHAPLYPPGLELTYEYYPTRDEYAEDENGEEAVNRRGWSHLMGNTGSCYYGHVHEAHGIFEVEGVTYANMGAITRGSLHESELSRAIKVCVWDSSDGSFTPVDVPHKPADEVFRIMQIREQEDKQSNLDDFLSSVGAAKIEFTSVEAVLNQIREMQLGDELERVVTELLTEASH